MKQSITKSKQIIKLISNAVEDAKQKTIKKIVKRLSKMSPNDVQTLARIINAL